MVRLRLAALSLVLAVPGFACETSEDSTDDEPKTGSESGTPSDDDNGSPNSRNTRAESDESSGDTDFGTSNDATDGNPFADEYDLETLADQLQGNWLKSPGKNGAEQVWRIRDRTVEVWDNDPPDYEKNKMTLRVVSPCKVRFVRTKDGREWTQGENIALGAKASFGETDVAVRTDRGLFACANLKHYEIIDGECTAWKWDSFRETWKKNDDVECSVDDESIVVGGTELKNVGDVYAKRKHRSVQIERVETLDDPKSLLQK